MDGSSPLMPSAQLMTESQSMEPSIANQESTVQETRGYDSDQDDKRLFYESCSQAYTKVGSMKTPF
jgi:hypothetical protein